MRIVYCLSLSDVVFFQLYQHDRAQGTRKRRLLVTWGGAAVVLTVMGVLSVAVGNWAYVILGAALAALYAFLVPARLRHNLRTTATRLYSRGPGARLLGRRALEVGESGLVSVTADGERATTPWSNVLDIQRTKDYVFIHLVGSAAHVAPWRGVQKVDLDALCEAVQRRNGGVLS